MWFIDTYAKETSWPVDTVLFSMLISSHSKRRGIRNRRLVERTSGVDYWTPRVWRQSNFKDGRRLESKCAPYPFTCGVRRRSRSSFISHISTQKEVATKAKPFHTTPAPNRRLYKGEWQLHSNLNMHYGHTISTTQVPERKWESGWYLCREWIAPFMQASLPAINMMPPTIFHTTYTPLFLGISLKKKTNFLTAQSHMVRSAFSCYKIVHFMH